jgi:peptide/nickel transport system substrate-binding protein
VGDKPGLELVAQDVALGLRRSGNEGRAALAAAGLSKRGTARAPIARVVELAPQPATPLLLDWLAEPALAVRDRRGRLFPGPYALDKDAGAWRLQRRSERPLPDARAASIRIASVDAAAAVSAFAKGEVQLVLGEGLAGLGAARAAGQGRALKLETVPGVIGLAINAKSGLLTDVRLRRALLLAADGAPMANRLALAQLVPQNRLWDGLPPPSDDRARPAEERRALAAALLREMGVGPEQPLRLSLLVPAGPEFQAQAETLAANLQPLGISLAVQRARPGGFAAARRSGAADLALVEQTARVADVVAHLDQWRCGRVRPCSGTADRLLDDAAAAGNDLTARQAAAAAAEAALMADPAFIPLLRPVRWALVANELSGFQANLLGRHPLGRIAGDGR